MLFFSLRSGWCGNNILRTPPATFYLLLRLDVVLEILFALSIESKSEKKNKHFHLLEEFEAGCMSILPLFLILLSSHSTV